MPATFITLTCPNDATDMISEGHIRHHTAECATHICPECGYTDVR